MSNRPGEYNFTEDQILFAIKGSCAIITNIAESLGCSWNTAKRQIETGNETIKKAFDDERERVIDKAESVILDAIDEKDIQTSKWYLSTIGKKRGYSEKMEIEHSGEVSNKFSIIGIDATNTDTEQDT